MKSGRVKVEMDKRGQGENSELVFHVLCLRVRGKGKRGREKEGRGKGQRLLRASFNPKR